MQNNRGCGHSWCLGGSFIGDIHYPLITALQALGKFLLLPLLLSTRRSLFCWFSSSIGLPVWNLSCVSVSISGHAVESEGGYKTMVETSTLMVLPFFLYFIFNMLVCLMHFSLILALHLSLVVGACEFQTYRRSLSGVKIIPQKSTSRLRTQVTKEGCRDR